MTALIDWLSQPAFVLWGAPASWAELLGVLLALAMVACNIREIHWGWPLALGSSLLYLLVFWRGRLYGEAMLQIMFAAFALWGWLQWLRGRRPDGSPLAVARLGRRGRLAALAAWAALWPAIALFLARHTDTDVPWWDAFPTAGSLVGQWLLARKFIENWGAWIVVNTASVGLFAYKALWLTVGLYVLFIALSVLGWRAWSHKARAGA